MNVKTIFSVKRMILVGLLIGFSLMSAQSWAVTTIDFEKGSENAYPGEEIILKVVQPPADQVTYYRWFEVGANGNVLIPGENSRTFSPTLNAPGKYYFVAETTVNAVLEQSLPVTITVAYTNPTVTVDSIKVGNPLVDKGVVNVEAFSGDPVEIKVTGSDKDNGPGQESNNLTYEWTQRGGTTVSPLNGATTDTLSFTAPNVAAPEQLLFRVKVTDDEATANRGTVEKDVILTVRPKTRPVAVPVIKDGVQVITSAVRIDPTGKTQDDSDISFTLDASGSYDEDNGPGQEHDNLTYLWTKVQGTGSDPADPTSASTSFTTGAITGPTRFAYDLTVTDDEGVSSEPVRVVLLAQPYEAPILEISQTAATIFDDQTVTFDITRLEDPDGGVVSVAWNAKVDLGDGNPPVDASDKLQVASDKRSAVLTPVLMNVNDNDRTFTITVTATDDDNASNSVTTKTLTVTVSDRGRLPTARITVDPDGAQPDGQGKYLERYVIHLNGGASDSPHPTCDAQPLSYQWELTTGASVTVLSPSDFGVDDEGGKKYWFNARVPSPEAVVTAKLTVTDCVGNKASTTKDFTILDDGRNDPPTAEAGNDRSVRPGEAFILNGSLSSDPDGLADIASYKWEQIEGASVALSNADKATASAIAPDKEDTLGFMLTVTDKSGRFSADVVTVNVAETNLPPVAKASVSPALAPSGALVTLLGNQSSDPEGGPLTYKWVQVFGTPVSINDFSSANASFTAPGTTQGMEFELEVTDVSGAKSTARVVVNVGAGIPPKADAGPDKTVKEGENVTLHGRGTDEDGNAGDLKYSWRLAGGLDVVLDDPGSAEPTFIAPPVVTPQTLTLELVVTDASGFKDVDQTVITVEDNGIDGFGSDFITRNPVVDDNVLFPSPIGFKVNGGDLVSLKAVPVSDYKDTQGKPEVLPFGLWEYKIKGANPELVVKFGDSAKSGTRWYLFKDNKWSEFKDEDGNTAVFNDDRTEVKVQLRDTGKADAGGATSDGFVTGTAGLGQPGVGTRDTGGRDTLGGGGGMGLPFLGLLYLTGLAVRRRRF